MFDRYSPTAASDLQEGDEVLVQFDAGDTREETLEVSGVEDEGDEVAVTWTNQTGDTATGTYPRDQRFNRRTH